MQLLSSPTSPYARKVRVVILEKGLADQVELLPGVPLGSDADAAPVRAANPLGKIPALIRQGAPTLFDSPVICEYLDSLGHGPILFPHEGEARWSALRLQALGDGVADAAFAIVMEGRRPESERSAEWLGRWNGAIQRAADAVEAELSAGEIAFDIGAISLACAFGYVAFRLPQIDWRTGRPALSAGFDRVSGRASIAATTPPV